MQRVFMKSIVGLGLLALSVGSTTAAVLTGPVVNPANGNSYYLLDQSSWTAARAEAVSLGGDLVTINDAAENAWVFAQFGAFGGVDRNLWIGLNDVAVEGTFVWSNGEPVTFTNWSPGEPNNSFNGATEQYVHMWAANQNFSRPEGRWNDFVNDPSPGAAGAPSRFFGVVEVVPEPATLASVFALSALLLRRRN